MLSRTNFSRALAQNLTVFLLIGLAAWIILLISAAQQLRNTKGTDYQVSFGPLTLDRLSRDKTTHGYNATITLEKGLLLYTGLWASAGTAAAIITYKKSGE